jgi:hypothetical protein
MWLAISQRVGTDESTTQQVVDLMTVSRNCPATYADMRTDYRCTETQTGGDANAVWFSIFRPTLDSGRASSQTPEPGEHAAIK